MGSIIGLNRLTSLQRLTGITSMDRNARLTRLARMSRMTSYAGRLGLKVRTGWVSCLGRIVIAELLTPLLLGFQAVLLILFSGAVILHG